MKAKFGAEHPVMWFRVFISTNARICCPTGLFLLNEKIFQKQTSAKPTTLYYREGQGELFTSFPTAYQLICGLVSPTLLCYIQSQFLSPCFWNCRSQALKPVLLLQVAISSQHRLQNGDLPAIRPGMEARSQPLGRGGPKESKQWETPAAPSHVLATCAVGGLQVRSKSLGDTLHICLLNEGPGHGK